MKTEEQLREEVEQLLEDIVDEDHEEEWEDLNGWISALHWVLDD